MILLLLSLTLQPPAQQPADLLRALDSPDWQVRSSALHRFNDMPMAELPRGFAEKAIGLLERESVDSAPGPKPEGGEGYGEYLITLMEGVVRLRDPRSLRGMAILGIQMSREAQEFVAEQGASALPFLDEAWRRDENSRESVGETWAYMLTSDSTRLSRNDRLQVISRVLAAHSVDAQAFTNAADDAELVMAIPLIERVATTEQGIVGGVARRAAARLKTRRDSMTAAALVNQFSETLDAFCLSRAERTAECGSLSVTLRQSSSDSLRALARRVDSGFLRHVWSDDERRVLAISARYIATRLH